MLKNKSVAALLFTLALFLSGYAVMEAQTIKQNFEWIIAKRITVSLNGITVQRGGITVTDGGVTLTDDDLTVTSGDLTITEGDVTVAAGDVLLAAGDLTLSEGDLTLSDNLYLTAQPVITVTGTFTPTGRYQPVIAGGAVGVTMTVGAEGMVTTITNIGTSVITITDTGTLKLSGNAALGQYDNITLRSDGTNWIEVGQTDN